MLPINNLGSSFFDLGRYDQAKIYYQESAELEKDNPLPHYNLGNIYSNEGDFSAAVGAYQKAIELNPSYTNALYNLAWVYFRNLEEYEKGAEMLQRVIQLEPDAVDAINELGELYRLWGKPNLAEEQYREAIRINPQFLFPYSNLGELFYQQANYEEAGKWFLKYLEQDTSNPDVYYFLALTEARQGETQKALEYLRQAQIKGYQDLESINQEEAFEKIRSMPEFKKLFENR